MGNFWEVLCYNDIDLSFCIHLIFNIILFSSVIVSPHGIRGRFTGCCASDVVKQICSRYYIIYGMLFTWQISQSVFSELIVIIFVLFDLCEQFWKV